MPRFAALTLLLALAACRSQPKLPEVEPLTLLTTRTPVEVEYESVVTYAGGFELPDDFFDVPAPEPDREAFDMAVQIVSIPRELATELFVGAPSGLGGWRVDREEAEAILAQLIDAGAATSLNDSLLSLYEGQSGWLTILNQTAYISGFEVEKSADMLIADPVVGVLNDGIFTRICPTRSPDGALQLDVELEMLALERPIRTSEATIPGSAVPVTLQLPVASRQVLRSAFAIEPDEYAVLGGLGGPDPDARILAFVRARSLPAGVLPAPVQSAP